MRKLLFLILVLTIFHAGAQDSSSSIDFAVMVLDTDRNNRVLSEDLIVRRLRTHGYHAFASHDLIPDIGSVEARAIRQTLLDSGKEAVLIIRPLDIGQRATIDSVQAYLSPNDYATVTEFVEGYRGHNLHTQAVIHVVGYVLDKERSVSIWQGVMWFDEMVNSREEGAGKLADMVVFNLDHYRPAIRRRLGLPPLPDA